MYARLVSPPTWTVAEKISDIVAVLSGETVVANLTADASSIIDASSLTSGWSVHDAVTSTNVVIKAPVADDPTQFKFSRLYASGETVISIQSYEFWNETTHVGSNPIGAIHSLNTSETTASVIYISGSDRHFLLNGTFNNNASGLTTLPGLFEHTRKDVWNTIPHGYLNVVVPANGLSDTVLSKGTASSFRWGRTLAVNGLGDVTGTAASGFVAVPLGNNFADGTGDGVNIYELLNDNNGYRVLDETKTGGNHPLWPFGVIAPQLGHFGGDISSLCDIYLSTRNFGNNFDELSYNGNTYVIWKLSTYRMAVRKG